MQNKQMRARVTKQGKIHEWKTVAWLILNDELWFQKLTSQVKSHKKKITS